MQSNLAEDVRFELTDHFWSLVFKTSAIDRSANLPYCGGMCWIRTSWPITGHDFTDRYSRQCCSHSNVVSEKGFEPSTPWSQIKCSAKLSYSENHFKFNIRSLYITLRLMSNFYLHHFVWCPKPESNRHDRSRGVLSPLRLPISPFGQFVFHFKFNIRSLYITLRLMSNFIYIILFCCNWKNIWSVYVLNFYTYSPHNYDHMLFGSLYKVKQTNYNKTWCPMSDSNWRPHDYKSSALPTELIGHFVSHST